MLGLKYIGNKMYFLPKIEREREILYFHAHQLIFYLVSIFLGQHFRDLKFGQHLASTYLVSGQLVSKKKLAF